ncbi:MAG: thioredoxin family protein [Bacteroidetes bacterium]|nr:thioredoxin family protein [Bacteroidota bacterium]
MRKLFFIVPLLLSVMACNARGEGGENTTGIKFKEIGWEATLKEAKKSNKLIFVDVYTSWCGPCKLLRKNTFPDKALGDYFNANFVNVAFDAEVGDGIKVAEKFSVPGYPCLLILDKDGNEIGRTMGYQGPEDLLRFGKTYNKAPEKKK